MTDYEAIEIIEIEGAESHEQLCEAFQQLINSGTVWQLQGFYGRTAKALVESGDCHLPTPTNA